MLARFEVVPTRGVNHSISVTPVIIKTTNEYAKQKERMENELGHVREKPTSSTETSPKAS